MNEKKALIFHDHFLKRGEIERMNIAMATILKGDIATTIWAQHSFDPKEMGFHGTIMELFRRYHRGWFGYLRMKWKFLFSGGLTRKYERLILSGETLSAMHFAKKGTEILYYAHNLPHELFDGKEAYFREVPFFYHEFYHVAHFIRKYLYLWEIKHVPRIATNSKMNQRFLMDWSGRTDIDVLYPPVNTLRFRPVKKKVPYVIQEHANSETTIAKEIRDYYISFARITEDKQVEKVVHAFVHMPDKPLIVLFHPTDPAREKAMKLASGSNNIFFLSETDEMRRSAIISSAIASFALGKNEDFGSITLESMACGVPVIANNAGGYRETIIQGRTGFFLEPYFAVYDIMQNVEKLTAEKSLTMQKDCVERADEFSLEKFTPRLIQYFENYQRKKDLFTP